MENFWQLGADTLRNLTAAFSTLVVVGLVFLIIAIVFKPKTWRKDVQRAIPETGVNIRFFIFNTLVSLPVVTFATTYWAQILQDDGMIFIDRAAWEAMPAALMLLIVVFVSDFVGYWRHRLEHTPLFWPSHAVHHSDTEMTWLTLERFHPVNVLTTVMIGTTVMLMMGLPVWAVIFNGLIRHYYGYLLHADLPWSFGKLGKIIVSPAMHRWHHSVEVEAHDTNFAVIFCLFDRCFGTYHMPGTFATKLGVTDDIPMTFRGQLMYMFERRAYDRFWRSIGRKPKPAPQS